MVRVTLNFTLQFFKKKYMIRKTSFSNHEFPCRTLKYSNYWIKEKNGEIITQIFRETLGALVRLLELTKA